jgi:phospholipid/cholesterol/gamma-HCH transport system substrate-binding protein
MEREANYVAVGAFVLLLIAMGTAFVLWYSDAGDSHNYTAYEINFTGSVSGLDQGSPVRYLGVDVGRVRRLSLDRQHPTRVKVIVDVDDAAPISAATRASLNVQGITGLLFVNLKQVPDADANAKPRQGERYPEIESVNSDFDMLLSSLPELVGRASKVIEHIDSVFSDKNLSAVAQTLESLRATTQGLPKTAEKVAVLIDQMRATLKEVDGAVVSIRGIADDSRPEIHDALQRLKLAADNLQNATDHVNKFMANSEVQMGHLTEHGLFELERLLRDSRAAANEFRDLSRSLKQQPSQLLFEKPAGGKEIPR